MLGTGANLGAKSIPNRSHFLNSLPTIEEWQKPMKFMQWWSPYCAFLDIGASLSGCKRVSSYSTLAGYWMIFYLFLEVGDLSFKLVSMEILMGKAQFEQVPNKPRLGISTK